MKNAYGVEAGRRRPRQFFSDGVGVEGLSACHISVELTALRGR